MLYAELGRYPLKVTFQTKMIKYWINSITGSKSKFSYMVYRHLFFNLQILDLTGHSDHFLNQNNIRTSYILIKRTLIEQFIQEWNGKLEGSNKGKQYKLFKHKLEKYLITLPIQYVIPLFKNIKPQISC